MSKYIPFRLRQFKDDDIKLGIANELERAAASEQELDRSDVIRAALRFYFRHRNNSPTGVEGRNEVPKLAISDKQTFLQDAPSPMPSKPYLNVRKKKDGKG